MIRRDRILVAVVGVMACAAFCGRCADVNDGLVAYYAFDDAADLGKDSSGNSYHGVVVGVDAIPGRIGGGAYFGGSAYILAEGLRTRDWGSEITVSVWFRKLNVHPDYAGIVNAGYGGEGSWEIRMEPDNLGGRVFAGITSLANPVGVDCPGGVVSSGEWFHAIMVYDSRRLDFYINGRPQMCPAHDIGHIISRNKSLSIGRAGEDSPRPQFFSGIIDEVRVYSRAMTPQEVRALCEPDSQPSEPESRRDETARGDPMGADVGEPDERRPSDVSRVEEPPRNSAVAKTAELERGQQDCCDTLEKLMNDWRAGNRERAIRELDRLSRNYQP